MINQDDEREMVAAHKHGISVARRHWPLLSGDPETISRHVYGSWENSAHERYAFLAGYVQEGKRLKAGGLFHGLNKESA